MIPDLVVVLIFAGAHDAVAGADCDDVDLMEVGECFVEGCVYRVTEADVAEEAVVVWGVAWEEALHVLGVVSELIAHCADIIAMTKD